MRESCSYGSVGVRGGNESLYPELTQHVDLASISPIPYSLFLILTPHISVHPIRTISVPTPAFSPRVVTYKTRFLMPALK